MPLARLPENGFELSLLAAQYRDLPLYGEFVELNRRISMLHADVLALLYHLARYAGGPVLELGAFTGGATLALARGVADAGQGARVVSVEMGGASSHPQYGTPDIVAAFQRNLEAHGLAAHCRLVIGHSREPAVIAAARQHPPYGCLLIDADGQIDEDLALYGAAVTPGAMLVVDDYFSPGAPGKELLTRQHLDRLARRGLVEPFGVHGWGTWFGRFL